MRRIVAATLLMVTAARKSVRAFRGVDKPSSGQQPDAMLARKRWHGAGFGVLLLLALSTTSAESTCPPVAAQPTPAQLQTAIAGARDRGLLWRFEKDGRYGYLYGTVHIGKLEWAPGRLIRQAVAESELLALELDPFDPETVRRINAPQPAPEAPLLPPALLERLRAAAANLCVPWQDLQDRPPLIVALQLATLEARWLGLDPGYGSELVLTGMAKAMGREFTALETPEIQRRALLSGSPAAQAHLVERWVSDIESGKTRRVVRRLSEAWARGDLAALERYRDLCECDTDPIEWALFERTAFGRNARLAQGIADLHRSGKRVFAAVGVLHLVDFRGVPSLLAAHGFKVERVLFDGR